MKDISVILISACLSSVSVGQTMVKSESNPAPWTLGTALTLSNDHIGTGLRLTSPSAYTFLKNKADLRYYLKADMLRKDRFVGSNFGAGMQLQYRLTNYIYPYLSNGIARLDAPNDDPRLGIEAGAGLALKFNVTDDISAALSVGIFNFWGQGEDSVAAFIK